MPRTDAQQRGMNFENIVAQKLDGVTQPGSGNQWQAQSDCLCHGMLLSCKAESKRTWAQTRAELKQAIDYAIGTGNVPALALLDDDDEELVVIRLDDLARALAGEVTPIPVKETRGQRVAREGSVPMILRNLS